MNLDDLTPDDIRSWFFSMVDQHQTLMGQADYGVDEAEVVCDPKFLRRVEEALDWNAPGSALPDGRRMVAGIKVGLRAESGHHLQVVMHQVPKEER